MRPTTALMHLAMAASVVSAWPSWLPQRDALVVRADDGDKSSSATPTGTESSQKPTSTGKSDKGGKTTGNLNTASAGPTNTKDSGSGDKKNSTSTPTHTEFAPDAPLGAPNMIIPATTALGTALYRISDYVTFSWNYTSLLGNPTAVDVLASCTAAHRTWTLTGNMSFATSVEYVWDTKEQANDAKQPLLTEQYQLIIKDSDHEIADRIDPGYLGAYPALQFGLYTGQPYVNRSEWTCPVCHANAAAPAVDGQALKFAAAMSAVTVLSFTWFVTGLGMN